jgi:hypothetical protein
MTGAGVLLKCRTPRARLVCGEIYTPMILRTQINGPSADENPFAGS